MSTFTDWNGPQGSNIRATDIIELTKAYRDMLEKFDEYQKKLNWDSEPIPGSNNSVTSGVVKQALNEVEGKLNNYYTRQAIDDTFAPKSSLTDKATKTELNEKLTEYAKTTAVEAALENYLKTNKLSEQQVIQNIKADIQTINEVLAQDSIEKVELKAKTIIGCIHAINEVQFQDAKIGAYIGGSNDVGVYYILGMIDVDKAGTAYIKYKNDKPFSAVVNWAITEDKKAVLNVLTDNRDLPGLRFIIAAGTDRNGDKHVYLAVQSEEWIPHFVSTDGKGMFTRIDFEVSGINIAPTKTEHFVHNNAECVVIAECTGEFGFNVSRFTVTEQFVSTLVTDDIKDSEGKQILKVYRKPADEDTPETRALVIGDKEYDTINFTKRPTMSVKIEGEEDPVEAPLVNVRDIRNLTTPIGAIIRWQVYHEEKVPVLDEEGNPIINQDGVPNPLQPDGEEAWQIKYVLDKVPEHWHACDGTPFDPQKLEILGDLYPDHKYPLEDFSIIKESEVESGNEDADTDPAALVTHKYLNKKIETEIRRSKEQDIAHDEAIANEAQTRAEADNGLSERITQNREGIVDLDTRLNAEVSARAEADNGLSDRITQNREGIVNLDGRVNQNKAGIQDLDQRLNAERQTRAEADTNFNDLLMQEATARDTADTALGNRITEETDRATVAETALGNRLDEETQARIDADDAEKLARETEDTNLSDLIAQLNKQSVLIFEGYDESALPTRTPVPVTGDIIKNGQKVILSSRRLGEEFTGFKLFVASVDAAGNITWVPEP